MLALPRGGVPVGFEVAKALVAPLDVLIVRKIGAPGHEELGIGAIVDGGDPHLVLNEEVVRSVGPRPAISRRKNASARRDRAAAAALCRGPAAAPVEGRVAIVIDDGIATGGTVKAALRGIARTIRRGWFWRCRSRRRKASPSSGPSATISCASQPPSRSTRWARITAISGRPKMRRSSGCSKKRNKGRRGAERRAVGMRRRRSGLVWIRVARIRAGRLGARPAQRAVAPPAQRQGGRHNPLVAPG